MVCPGCGFGKDGIGREVESVNVAIDEQGD